MPVKRKVKGLNAERELVRMFWEHGWFAVRVAGSGAISHPTPDVIAANGLRRLVIECKTTKSVDQYLNKKQVAELRIFARSMLAEPWIGVRFDKAKWFFMSVEDIRKTSAGFVVSQRQAKMTGLLFEELVQG